MSDQKQLAREAKAIVALAFRNGPIEDLHAGVLCPTCGGKPGYSKITDAEMAGVMSNAVDHVFKLLLLKSEDPAKYEDQIRFGARYITGWADPAGMRDGNA